MNAPAESLLTIRVRCSGGVYFARVVGVKRGSDSSSTSAACFAAARAASKVLGCDPEKVLLSPYPGNTLFLATLHPREGYQTAVQLMQEFIAEIQS